MNTVVRPANRRTMQPIQKLLRRGIIYIVKHIHIIGLKHLFAVNRILCRYPIHNIAGDFILIPILLLKEALYIAACHGLIEHNHRIDISFFPHIVSIQRIRLFSRNISVKVVYKIILGAIFRCQFTCFDIVDISTAASNSSDAHFSYTSFLFICTCCLIGSGCLECRICETSSFPALFSYAAVMYKNISHKCFLCKHIDHLLHAYYTIYGQIYQLSIESFITELGWFHAVLKNCSARSHIRPAVNDKTLIVGKKSR